MRSSIQESLTMMTPAVAVSRQDVKDLIEKLLTANIETSVSRQHTCTCMSSCFKQNGVGPLVVSIITAL